MGRSHDNQHRGAPRGTGTNGPAGGRTHNRGGARHREQQGGPMTTPPLSENEHRFLTSGYRTLGRVATVGRDGTPHVVPSGWTYNEALGTLDVTGRDVQTTKKFRDVARTGRAAIVIDGVAEGEGWNPWAIEIAGRAESIKGPPALIRIHPERVRSWGLDGAD